MALVPRGDDNSPLDVEFGGYSTAGIKTQNQDAFAAHLPPGSERIFKGAVACIADGLSSSEQAQLASQTSVTDFIQNYLSTPDTWSVRQSAARVLTSLNNWLFQQGQQASIRHHGMMTTFSALICKSTTGHMFHCGDSRLYRWRNETLELLSRDHAHHQPGGSTFLTRALGMDSHLEVDYQQLELQAGDLYLLSTDGLHGFLTQKQMGELLQRRYISLEACAKTLVNTALEAGSDDNVSCLLVRIKNLPVAELEEVHRQLTDRVIPPAMVEGNKLDGYEVLRILHSGTRSLVYLVQNEQDRQFVLKAPSPNFADDPIYLDGFIREQWVGQRIHHPQVMKIFPQSSESRFLYHICEFIEGTTLRQWMIDNPKPSLDKVREIAAGMISAVRALQRLGMVHRDLKPENFILNAKGQVRLIDFGTVQVDSLDEIASPLSDSVPVGSVDYIAPEYLNGGAGQVGKATHESDIFSLGVIIYELCTGHLPYKSIPAIQNQPQRAISWDYISARHWRSELPQWLDLTLAKACAAHPKARYSVMSEMLTDLSNPNASLIEQHQQKPLFERNPLLFWKLCSGLLLGVVLVQWYLLSGRG